MPPQVTTSKILAVMAGAAIGGALRYLIATAITERAGAWFPAFSRFPWGTFTANVTGCFLIGILATILSERAASPLWSLFLVTGILGGYTTFSAFGWETVQLSRQGEHAFALANALGSVAVGYLAVWCGVLLARR